MEAKRFFFDLIERERQREGREKGARFLKAGDVLVVGGEFFFFDFLIIFFFREEQQQQTKKKKKEKEREKNGTFRFLPPAVFGDLFCNPLAVLFLFQVLNFWWQRRRAREREVVGGVARAETSFFFLTNY
jgi:hypothetical protein